MGGPAQYFLVAKREDTFLAAIKWAKARKLPFLVIGEGSNLLVSEKGFRGVVIKNSISGIQPKGRSLLVKAGTRLKKLVGHTINSGLEGAQRLNGIPGTIGGAIYGNAGAYGQTISDCLIGVRVFDGKKTRWLSKKSCGLAYRESFFKKADLVILEAEFKFAKARDLGGLKKDSRRILALRNKKYPKGLNCPGSFFKNFEVKKVDKKILKEIPPEKIVFGKLPAGYLLEAVGAKGKKKGSIKIAPYHANLFINTGRGLAQDFYRLARFYQNKVKVRFGIVLEPEVQLIGFSRSL
jgi:UDP-N-acetylmuramate dehydrogenase